ncbi:MAG TPA: phospho-N-acetylmuramoyl-pentapeptide-transferase [Dehalococcoidia bacterium]|nr:phospho-N-acetylmuramoyl-pentapeptide-transferase [Dehalococcoidia bacterium]
MLAGCLAMVVALACGPLVLAELKRRKLGKEADVEGPAAYANKAGTPTMGGIIFLAAIVAAATPFAAARNADLLLPLAVMLAGGVLGGYDDLQTLVGRGRLTGHERWFFFVKWGVLLGLGVVAASILYFEFDLDSVVVPHFGAYSLDALYLPAFVAVFVIATSGAVITDGMDGLMAGVSALAYAAYGAIALSQGQDELGAFCFAVVGGLAGFLWFNAHPAQVFMGDLGAQALAVGLVVVAFMSGWWLLLPVIGVIFVAEGVSDVVQIGYFKLSGGKRVFRMAPIHYHFQLGGWAETQVVARFWIIGLLGGLAGIALAMVE